MHFWVNTAQKMKDFRIKDLVRILLLKKPSMGNFFCTVESTLCSCLCVKELLARNKSNVWNSSDCNRIGTHNYLVRKWILKHFSQTNLHVFWVLICTVHLNVCSYHVTYAFQGKSTHCSCLNVKEFFTQNIRDVKGVPWYSSNCRV